MRHSTEIGWLGSLYWYVTICNDSFTTQESEESFPAIILSYSRTLLGGDDRLLVTVMGNADHPECNGDIQATPRSCQYILDEMYKDHRLEIFGKFQREVTVALPLTLRARECFLVPTSLVRS